jgi:nicotinamidase-related amidase
MTLSTLDPKAALVVIDLQEGLRGRSTAPHPLDDVIDRAAQLAKAFRNHQLPVVLVNCTAQAPGRTEAHRAAPAAGPASAPAAGAADLVEELDAQGGDHLITKERWGAFYRTPLDSLLRGLGVTQVVVVGIATSIGVESTARSAYEHGYNVVVATDAMTDINPAAHASSVQHIFPKLGETATTGEILEKL